MEHNGNLIKRYVEKNLLNHTRMAERMGITLPTLLSAYSRSTLQSKTLWNASLALEHNFLFDIGMELPAHFSSEYNSESNNELRKKIEELEKENERLKIEISVYEKIVKV